MIKQKVIAAMIQELTEELQAIEQESLNNGQDSEATQEGDLEQEDSENCLTDDKGQSNYSKHKTYTSLFPEQDKPDNIFFGRTDIISHSIKRFR